MNCFCTGMCRHHVVLAMATSSSLLIWLIEADRVMHGMSGRFIFMLESFMCCIVGFASNATSVQDSGQ